MDPYFRTAKSFADVSITSDGVDTASFLHASDDFVNMFDLLGSGVFGFVQTDLRNNIGGVRARYQASTGSTTLEQLVTTEVNEHQRQGTACLVRLVRGLYFTCQALQEMQRDRQAELHVCFRRSYDVVLRHHHSFLVRSVVTLAIRAVPHRHDFYVQVAQGAPVDEFDAELAKWLVGLDSIVTRMRQFLEGGGYGKV
ncbi:glycolipid transfer protein [Cristinia sonorae]|uniref:Glycolipid transfer protein n=1 Tax=Cristinia sonorae TaxID=1940300 RepID=A0A8K0UU71_9AGAR|nr:glycolipid transfer protein [Cristinia sonorae]